MANEILLRIGCALLAGGLVVLYLFATAFSAFVLAQVIKKKDYVSAVLFTALTLVLIGGGIIAAGLL